MKGSDLVKLLALQCKVDGRDNEIDSLVSELEKVHKELSELKEHAKFLEDRNENQNEQLDFLKKAVVELSNQRDSYRRNSEKLNLKVADLKSENENLSEQMNDIEKILSDIEDARKIKNLQNAIRGIWKILSPAGKAKKQRKK